MKRKLYILFGALIGLFFASCENSIDDFPLDYLGVEDVVKDSTYVIGFVENMYTSIPNGYSRLGGTSMIASTTDEAVECGNNTEAENMALGVWAASNTHDDVWSDMYSAIRKTNVFLDEIYPAIPDGLFGGNSTVERLKGQAYFFRAYFHFELLKRYGGVPIVTSVLKAGEGTDLVRNSYDECVQFIISECDKAEAILPLEWPAQTLNFGKITKGAALALKARALLIAASPLYNDPSNTSSTVEHGAYSETKWKSAAAAAHEIIALNYYNLYTSYQAFFTTLNNNKELIMARMSGQNNNVEQLNGPSGYTNGEGGACPTLDLVDSYLMEDGLKFDWNNPSHALNPFANREPRFYASILYNGASWMGDIIDTYEGGNDLGSVNSTKTGFYLKKFMSESAKWFGGSNGKTYHCFPHFRYAEILLNYAESMNEAYGPSNPSTFSLSSIQALNQVRTRAGVPNVSLSVNKDELRQLIRDERKIELAFEEQRHLDLRRWKIAQDVLNKPVSGLRIVKNVDGTYTYQKVTAQNRVFKPEMYLYPIPQNEINRSVSLIQNTGW